MPEPVQPGWKPDPEREGMLRWWNGLGWSDARKAAEAQADRFAAIRPVAEDDARRGAGALEAMRTAAEAPGSTARRAVADAQRAAQAASGRLASEVPASLGGRAAAGAATAARTAAAVNPFAAGAVVLGILGIVVGLYGVIPLIGLVVSLSGLVRSRRLARQGERRTGFGQSIAGTFLSVIGLITHVPDLIVLLNTLDLESS